MADVKRWVVTEPYLTLDCGLGEAPFYERSSHTLRFVDIVKDKVHVIDLNRGPSSLQSFDVDAVSTTADIDGVDDEIIVGAKHGFALMQRSTGRLEYIKNVWDERDGPGKDRWMRMNDGAVDTNGRYWVGAMNDPKVRAPSNEGVLFRLDPDLKLHRMIKQVSIPNGMGWSADDKTFYFTDTPTGNIFMFDYDASTGNLSNRRVFFHVDDENAVPDGFAMDVEGCFWVALCGGGKVIRVSKEAKIVGEIILPTRMITCPGFVDEDLFITSAEEEDPEQFPDSVKLAGSLFRVNVGVPGLPLHKFKRSK